jgi:hypothetical protein
MFGMLKAPSGLLALPARPARTVNRAAAPLRAASHIRGPAVLRPLLVRKSRAWRALRIVSAPRHMVAITV